MKPAAPETAIDRDQRVGLVRPFLCCAPLPVQLFLPLCKPLMRPSKPANQRFISSADIRCIIAAKNPRFPQGPQ